MQLTKPETNTPRTPKTPKGKTPKKSKPAKSPKSETPAKNGAKVEKKPVTPQSAAPQSSKKFNRNEKRSLSTERPKSEGKPQQSAQNKTPESNKKRRQRKGSNSSPNKKQKIDFNKSKKINTNEQQKQEHPVYTDVKVVFPNVSSYKESISKVLDECESVTIKTVLILNMNQDMVKSKIEEIEKIKIEGNPLRALTEIRTEIPLKRVIRLKKYQVDVIELKNFYEAKSVDQIINFKGRPTRIYVLTFESEEAAAIASKKVYTFEEKEYHLGPCCDGSEKENGSATMKQGKQVQVAKTSEKPVQKKEEEEEEEEEVDDDDDDEEEELDSDDMEDIDMDDDDDDDDEEEDDDDDDEEDDDDE